MDNMVIDVDNLTYYIEIEGVKSKSIADELDLQPGDKLIKINGQPIRDFIDYKFLITDDFLELEVLTKDNEYWILEVEKEYDQSLGIEFSEIIFDDLMTCHNNCIFCFVNQAPANCRRTLNLKDDDYRFSFLQGSYITLTNLSQKEFNRIKRLHLSPLNISVHSTNPKVRKKMLNNKHAGEILDQIKELVEAGIELNTQIVLCPDINDGDYLKQTIKDLGQFIPQIKSLAIVPVGLTKYRDDLYDLRSFTSSEANQIIELVNRWQSKFQQEYGTNFVYLADEFYFLADQDIPKADYYDDFLQLENGVGMVRVLLDQWGRIKDKLPKKIDDHKEISVVTGVLGTKALKPIINGLNAINNLKVNLIEVENKYFGSEVTVTGLLTANDILTSLKQVEDLGDLILVPQVVLNDQELFLDDVTWENFKGQLSVPIITVENNVLDLVEKMLGIDFGGEGNNEKTSSSNCW